MINHNSTNGSGNRIFTLRRGSAIGISGGGYGHEGLLRETYESSGLRGSVVLNLVCFSTG